MKFYFTFLLVLVTSYSSGQLYLNDTIFFTVNGHFDTVYKYENQMPFYSETWIHSFNNYSSKKHNRASVKGKFQRTLNAIIEKDYDVSNIRFKRNNGVIDSTFTILWVARVKDINLHTPQYQTPVWFEEGTLIWYVREKSTVLLYKRKQGRKIKKLIMQYHWLLN